MGRGPWWFRLVPLRVGLCSLRGVRLVRSRGVEARLRLVLRIVRFVWILRGVRRSDGRGSFRIMRREGRWLGLVVEPGRQKKLSTSDLCNVESEIYLSKTPLTVDTRLVIQHELKFRHGNCPSGKQTRQDSLAICSIPPSLSGWCPTENLIDHALQDFMEDLSRAVSSFPIINRSQVNA
jgi:hypothetical protein